MDDDRVTVPPEVRDGLEGLEAADALHPGERQRAIDAAADRDLDATVRWLEKVDDVVFDAAAEGRFVGGDEI